MELCNFLGGYHKEKQGEAWEKNIKMELRET
jgi:hypothetical protein